MDEYDGMDEDYYQLTCPKCKQTVYAGDFFPSKGVCCFCLDDLGKEDAALLDLVKKVIEGPGRDSS
jgi:hypothetical protein